MAKVEQVWSGSTYVENYGYVRHTATSANTKIDYNGIVAACDNILELAETGLEKISKDIKNVKVGPEALIVEDKTMEPLMEEIETFVKSIATEGVSPSLEEIKQLALEAYNKIQKDFNDKAMDEFDRKVANAKQIASQS